MKKIICLFLLLLNVGIVFAQDEKLTNQSVLDMVEMGFSEDVVITKIKTSGTDFNTGLDALKVLKKNGISDAIIMAIMNTKKGNDDQDNAVSEDKVGLYYEDSYGQQRILPTVFSGTKTNTLGSAFSYGIASAGIKSILNNAESTNVVKSNNPLFVFYFAPQKQESTFAVGANNWWFFSATSPNEFVLVKLDKKKKKRELKTGSVNVYAGSNIGVDEKQIIPFTIEIVGDYEFNVTPKSMLEDGEYCFFYQGIVPSGGVNQSVFDFSVQCSTRNEVEKTSEKSSRYNDEIYAE